MMNFKRVVELSFFSTENFSMSEVRLDLLKNGIALITLNRPSRGNSITLSMIEQIVDIFQNVEKDPTVRSVVITGEGKFFCTGMDLSSETQQNISVQLKDGDIGKQGVLLFETIRCM